VGTRGGHGEGGHAGGGPPRGAHPWVLLTPGAPAGPSAGGAGSGWPCGAGDAGPAAMPASGRGHTEVTKARWGDPSVPVPPRATLGSPHLVPSRAVLLWHHPGAPGDAWQGTGGDMSGWVHQGGDGKAGTVPRCPLAWPAPLCHTRMPSRHPGAPGWPTPPRPAAMADAIPSHRCVPSLVPNPTSEAGRHVHARPGAGGPGDVGAGHQQLQHGHVPLPPCHRGALTKELPRVPERVPEWHGGGRGAGTLLLSGLGGCHRVTACPCYRVPMSLCPHVPVSPFCEHPCHCVHVHPHLCAPMSVRHAVPVSPCPCVAGSLSPSP